jgi:hypothetical protein
MSEKGIKDADYDSMVMAIANGVDFKKKAIGIIGFDESQVSEIAPIHFEDYVFEDAFARQGKDGVYRSSTYQISWIFFGSSQVFVYQYSFNMDDKGKKEITQEYFLKDITNFSTTTASVETEILGKNGKWVRTAIETTCFELSAAGGKLRCAMKQNDYAERSIQGMKAKLREIKGN